MSLLSFQYKAIDHSGAQTTGMIQAPSREDAYQQIIAGGMRPLRITGKWAKTRSKKVTLKDLSHLTYQLSVLMEAKIQLVDGLRSIAEHEQKPMLRQVIEDIAKQIEDGSSVTDAISPHRAMFGDVYVETISAAETSGNMIEVLASLAAMLDRQYEMTKNIKGALMYPICVLSVLGLAVLFLMNIVVPRFATMFASRGIELPLVSAAGD